MYLFRDTAKKILGVEGGAFVLIVVVIGGLQLDAGGAPGARPVPVSLREKEFVEAARALGASKVAPGGAAHPAQCARPGDRGRHHRRGRRHHRGIDPVVPRPRLSAGHPHLGASAVRAPRTSWTMPRTGRCSRVRRSSSRCSPSTSSATACATPSTRGACSRRSEGPDRTHTAAFPRKRGGAFFCVPCLALSRRERPGY